MAITTSKRAARRYSPESETKHVKRSDIQGLRALAVLAVVLDHLLGWPKGGFVGVDVFFVISGFLITGLLVREHETTGRISFSNFYRRRARRILPASVIVLAVTVVAAYFVFTESRFTQTAWDSVWSLFFSANLHFASIGTDYFNGGGVTSPFQHFWSLAVEEQFYFVWPWLMLAIYLIAKKRSKDGGPQGQRAVAIATIVIVLASFTWAMVQTSTHPTSAYFSTLARAWELGVGALLAVSATQIGKIPAALRPLLAWVGLAGIVYSLFFITSDSAFPAPWGAIPVIATASVIAAGIDGKQRYLAPITNPVAVYIGAISYSLYLWHFPVIILMAGVLPTTSVLYLVITVPLMAGLAVASYRLIEEPVRRSSWLLKLTESERRQLRDHKRQERLLRTRTARGSLIALAGLAVVTGALTTFALIPPTPPTSLPHTASVVPADAATTSPDGEVLSTEAILSQQVVASLATEDWPVLVPSLDELGFDAWAPEIVTGKCLEVTAANVTSCRFGSETATKLAVVAGDSIAASWMPAVRAALEPRGYAVQMITFSGCPIYEVTLNNERAADCDQHRIWTLDQIASMTPDLVILSNAFEENVESKDGTENEKAAAWGAGATATLAKLPSATKTVVLMAPAGSKNPNECVTLTSHPSDCVGQISGLRAKLETAAAQAVTGAANDNVSYVNTNAWFCSTSGKCPLFIGSAPVRIDANHLTGVFSASLGPVLSEALIASNAVPAS